MPLFAAATVVFLALSWLAWQAGHVAVSFQVSAQDPTRLQVFYDGRGQFAEDRSRWLLVASGASATATVSTQGRQANWLRVDTDAGMGATLCDLRLDGSPVGDNIEVASSSGVHLQQSAGCLRVVPIAGSADPQVLLHVTGGSARYLARAGRLQRIGYAAVA